MKQLALLVLACGAAGLAGCEKLGFTPTIYDTPDAVVTAVELTEVSPQGASARIVIDLTNTNDEPMPLKIARYRLTLGGGAYSGNTHANATVPARGGVRLTLTGAVPGAPGDTYDVSGAIEYQPPGEVRELLTDFNYPLPTIPLRGAGQVTGTPKRVDSAVITPPSWPTEAPTDEPPTRAPAETDAAPPEAPVTQPSK